MHKSKRGMQFAYLCRSPEHLFLFSLIELLIVVTMQLVHVKSLQITKDSVAQYNCLASKQVSQSVSLFGYS